MNQCDQDIRLIFRFKDAEYKNSSLHFSNPAKIISAYRREEVLDALTEVCNGVGSGLYAAGYLAYEAAGAFDPVYRTFPPGGMPIVWFALFESPELIDLAHWQERGSYAVGAWRPEITKDQYDDCITRIKNEIKQGNTYQVNYTIGLRTKFEGDDFAYFQRLCQAQKCDYAAYLNTGRYRILSVSPELFFHWENDTITTKPMKGTARRGFDSDSDRRQERQLYLSEKNRAENLMIVDLLRNDLGRLARLGSVKTTRLFEIEKYPTVFQMTSTVQAEVPQETHPVEVFRALFPCGSITGAPKASTMGIIADLEHSPRGVYCGAIGFLSPQKKAVFNVPIRTVVIDKKDGAARYGVGGGITWDSSSVDEYDEILAKAQVLAARREEFDLLETMLLEKGDYMRLEGHLQRLRSSAEYFNYAFSRSEVIEMLSEHARRYPFEARRVRLLLSENGGVRVESEPFAKPDPQAIPTVSLAQEPIDRNNRLMYHKTTCREVYERHRNAAPRVFDVLLWNEDEEITEFTIANVVVELGGRKITPPLSCGLLPGVLRAELLAAGVIFERTIKREELERADKIWMINSLRGWIPVKLKKT